MAVAASHKRREPGKSPPSGTTPRKAAPPTQPRSATVRRVIKKVEVSSVFKISLVIYLSLLFVFLIAMGALFALASVVGMLHRIEHFIDQLFGLKSFSIASLDVLLITIVVGIVLSVIGACLNGLGAALYNLAADVVGGLRVTEIDGDPPRRGR